LEPITFIQKKIRCLIKMDPLIIQQIRNNRTNSNLDLSFSIYDAEIMKRLADALKVNSTITNLNLSSNQFGL